jgi:GNAT superfamily N-acetyltransferase
VKGLKPHDAGWSAVREPHGGAAVRISVDTAAAEDAAPIAALQTRVADDLTRRYGPGHWSAPVTESSVARAIATSRVIVARDGEVVAGTLRLVTKKPWAIDPAYFVHVRRPLYLLSMAVDPSRQRNGIGRMLLSVAAVVARAWPADAIRLDAYDSEAGAGPFYSKCGYREVGRVSYRAVPLVYYEMLLS